MRIIAGDAKGRRIAAPSGRGTRPTSDRVKESLFNILGSAVPDVEVLDLFAGAGNLGLEAVSRGAKHCIFIDNSKAAIKIIHDNINSLGYEDFCQVYHNDAFSALDILQKRGAKFHIIFLDPPYHKDIIPVLVERIGKYGLIEAGGIIVAEHDIKDQIPHQVLDLTLIKTWTYGNTAISLYTKLEG